MEARPDRGLKKGPVTGHKFMVAVPSTVKGSVRLLGPAHADIEGARKHRGMTLGKPSAIYKVIWGKPLVFVEGDDLKQGDLT